MSAYPVTLTNLEHVRCIVVGGGKVAERKVGGLLDGGATQVTVISPDLTSQLQCWRDAGRIVHWARPYSPGDLYGGWLVFAATDRTEVNAQVLADATARGLLVNVADAGAAGNFHTSAAVRRGDLLVTIATGGASPALAALIRRRLEQSIGPEYAELSAWLADLRQGDAQHLAAAERTALYRALATEEVLEWLRGGERERLRSYTADLLAALPRGAS